MCFWEGIESKCVRVCANACVVCQGVSVSVCVWVCEWMAAPHERVAACGRAAKACGPWHIPLRPQIVVYIRLVASAFPCEKKKKEACQRLKTRVRPTIEALACSWNPAVETCSQQKEKTWVVFLLLLSHFYSAVLHTTIPSLRVTCRSPKRNKHLD